MRTLRADLAERLERARGRAGNAKHRAGEAPPPGWAALLRALLTIQVARAAQRVLERRPVRAIEGRLGGEVSSATMAPPAPMTRPERVEKPRPAPASEEKPAATKDPATAGRCPHEAVSGVWPIAKRTFKEYSADNGSLMAASVAFYFMLSIIPLAVAAVALLGMVLGSSEHTQHQVQNFLGQFLLRDQKKWVWGIIEGVIAHRGKLGVLGLGTLLLTATGGFATLETAINVTWRAPGRNFLWNKVFAFLMMIVVGGLFAISFGITATTQWASSLPPLHWLERSWLLQVVGWVVPVIVSGLMFTAIYKLFPNTRVEWKPALIAGFITAVVYELFKNGYALYAEKFNQSASQAATYGALASFVGLVVWIYYSSALILIGSELTWVLQGCPERTAEDAPVAGAES